MVNRHGRVMAVVAAAVMAVGLSACSSSSSSSTSSSPASSASSHAKATGSPIVVGVECTCSGTFGANILDAEDAYEAWVKTVNAAGGLVGHPVHLITEDDGGVPGTSVSQVQTLIADHVDAIVDLSIVDTAWASTVQSAGIPVVGADETEEPFFQNPDFYPEGQTDDSVLYASAAVAKAAGAHDLGYLYCAEAASCAQGLPLFETAAKQVGASVIYDASISATAPNYTAQCVAAQQQHVDGLFIGDSSQIVVRVATNCTQQGYKPIYVTEGEGFTMSMATTPGLSSGLYSEYGTIPFFANLPAVAQMDAAMDHYFPGVRQDDAVWSDLGAEAWASGLLLQAAVQASGMTASTTPSPSLITKGLDSLHGTTLDGMAPPLTFHAGQPHPVDCWFTARVKGGTPVLLNGGKVTCENGTSASS